MKIFFPAIMAVVMLLSVSVKAQQVSDEVLPEAETPLATKFGVSLARGRDFACSKVQG